MYVTADINKEIKRLTINEWNEDDRPREKFMSKGAGALSPAELLAILIGSGSASENAVELMKRVLADCGNSLKTLGSRSIKELCEYKGIGEAKAITIAAACEFGNRRASENVSAMKLDNSLAIYRKAMEKFRDLPHEESWLMMLNNNLRFIDFKRVGVGGLTSTIVDVRLVLREALLHRATHIVLCHNHPGGDCKPSAADDQLTSRLCRAASLLEIKLIDHLVVGDADYYSYSDHRRMELQQQNNI